MANKTAPSSRLCLCAPTTHPGSFRCSLHRNPRQLSTNYKKPPPQLPKAAATATATAADLVKTFLMQVIKPSSHDLQRRRNFQPTPSRFRLVASDHRLAVS